MVLWTDQTCHYSRLISVDLSKGQGQVFGAAFGQSLQYTLLCTKMLKVFWNRLHKRHKVSDYWFRNVSPCTKNLCWKILEFVYSCGQKMRSSPVFWSFFDVFSCFEIVLFVIIRKLFTICGKTQHTITRNWIWSLLTPSVPLCRSWSWFQKPLIVLVSDRD